MAEPVLALDGIETCYGLSQVLFGVSLAIAPGEMVTLMGRNGMGKTTTVRSIMGLTPARAWGTSSCGISSGLVFSCIWSNLRPPMAAIRLPTIGSCAANSSSMM